MELSEQDYRFSMVISTRARDDTRNEGLRTLLVHRLLPNWKAVWRRSNSGRASGLLCERCEFWIRFPEPDDPVAIHRCPRCDTYYLPELVVYRQVSVDEIDEDLLAEVDDLPEF